MITKEKYNDLNEAYGIESFSDCTDMVEYVADLFRAAGMDDGAERAMELLADLGQMAEN